MLALGESLHGGATASANAGSDRGTFATAGESSDQGAERGAATNDRSGTLAARASFFLNITRRENVRFALISDAFERDGELAGTLKFSRRTGLDQFQARVQSLGQNGMVVHDGSIIERRIEVSAGRCG